MAKGKQEKGAIEAKPKKRYSVIGGVWQNFKKGSGTQFLKIQVLINNEQRTLVAWPNQRKNHPLGPDWLVYVEELSE